MSAAEELSKGVEGVDLNKDESEAPPVDLPPELAEMIKQTVEEGEGEAATSKEVTADNLRTFFEDAVVEVKKEELLNKLISETKDIAERGPKLEKIKEILTPVYEGLWKGYGIDPELGRHAISEHRSILSNSGLDDKLREQLMEKMGDFSRNEQKLVRRLIMGEELYHKQIKEEDIVNDVRDELEKELKGLSPKDRKKRIAALREQGTAFRERLQSMGQEAAMEYIKKPSDEDQQLLYKLTALTMLVAPQAGGHSHNGKPCGGHGHAQKPKPKPCCKHGHGDCA